MSRSFCFAAFAIALLSGLYSGCGQLPEINIHISTTTTTTQPSSDSPPADPDALENAPEIDPGQDSQGSLQPDNPDRQAAAAVLEPTGQTSIVSDRSTLDDPEWQRALAILRQRPGIRNGRGTKITLGRVFWEGAQPGERVQLVGVKLNDLKPTSTRGGRFKEVENGGFFVIEHINSRSRQNNRDPVEIGAYFHNRPTLWADVPSSQLGILGDIRLDWAAVNNRGKLRVIVNKPEAIQLTKLRVGPAIVGGPYGRDFEFDAHHSLEIPNITAGTYKLLFPEFDYQNSRWTVTIEPGKITELEFTAQSQTQITKVNEQLL